MERDSGARASTQLGFNVAWCTSEAFLEFLKRQLHREAHYCFGIDLELDDVSGTNSAASQWLHSATPARLEKWVPFHTGLCVHERLVSEEIYSKDNSWDDRQCFIAMFIFRAHCCCEMFREIQLPLLRQKSFWTNIQAALAQGGPMEVALLKYRAKKRKGKGKEKGKRQKLQTSAFRIIPVRICTNKNRNLVLNVCKRMRTLANVAEEIYPLLLKCRRREIRPYQLNEQISTIISANPGLGPTWVKMLTVSIDMVYPDIGLLDSECEVGIGAKDVLRCVEKHISSASSSTEGRSASDKERLIRLTKELSSRATPDFWELLKHVEQLGSEKLRHCSRLSRQLNIGTTGLTLAVVQVQLCEWRQFLQYKQQWKPKAPPRKNVPTKKNTKHLKRDRAKESKTINAKSKFKALKHPHLGLGLTLGKSYSYKELNKKCNGDKEKLANLDAFLRRRTYFSSIGK